MPRGAVSVTDQMEFSDADFRVVATGDQSKKLKLLLSGLTTATTRVWTAQNKDGTVALLEGTTTNDNASAGRVGEFIEADLATGSATALTTNTSKTITSISLTAGDWDVFGLVGLNPAATTSFTRLAGSISLTTDTFDQVGCGWFQQMSAPNVPGASMTGAFAFGPRRVSIASTTTVYLVGFATFTVSTMTAYGHISARRVR